MVNYKIYKVVKLIFFIILSNNGINRRDGGFYEMEIS